MVRRLIPAFVALALLLMPADTGRAAPAFAPLGTTFTYQGRITQAGLAVNGTCDFQFGVFAAVSGGGALGTQSVNATAVSDGLFTVLLDFGAGIFTGEARFLEIAVRCPAGAGGFTTLSPRQQLAAAPQALFASSTGALRTVPVAVALPSVGQVLQFDGTQWAPASVAGAAPSWLLAGNAGTNPATQFLGTTDAQPINIRVNNAAGWRLEPGTGPCAPNCTPNVVGGFSGNTIGANVEGAVIGGGGDAGNPNSVTAVFSVLGGGRLNTVSGGFAFIGGGDLNSATQDEATVGGGRLNQATDQRATVAGGDGNEASGEASTVSGGSSNTASFTDATVGGGNANTASGVSATVPGGEANTAAGEVSFAAGRRAKANNQGSFVWSDSQNADFASDPGGVVSGTNTFHVRAGGGIRLVVGTQTCTLISAVANFQCSGASSRTLKTQYALAEPRATLDALAAMPVAIWSYLADGDSVHHIGPMAEDFKAAFGMGESDKMINSLDAQGVAFAAIQGLYQLVKEKEAEIGALRVENVAQQERLDAQQAQVDAQQARVADLEREVAELRATTARHDALEARLAALEQRQAEGGR